MTLPKKNELLDITKRTVVLGAGMGIVKQSGVPYSSAVTSMMGAYNVKKTADVLFKKKGK